MSLNYRIENTFEILRQNRQVTFCYLDFCTIRKSLFLKISKLNCSNTEFKLFAFKDILDSSLTILNEIH